MTRLWCCAASWKWHHDGMHLVSSIYRKEIWKFSRQKELDTFQGIHPDGCRVGYVLGQHLDPWPLTRLRCEAMWWNENVCSTYGMYDTEICVPIRQSIVTRAKQREYVVSFSRNGTGLHASIDWTSDFIPITNEYGGVNRHTNTNQWVGCSAINIYIYDCLPPTIESMRSFCFGRLRMYTRYAATWVKWCREVLSSDWGSGKVMSTNRSRWRAKFLSQGQIYWRLRVKTEQYLFFVVLFWVSDSHFIHSRLQS